MRGAWEKPARLSLLRNKGGGVFEDVTVAAGLAERVELQLSYAIGVARPTSISIETFGTGVIDDAKILDLVHKHFDLRPAAIIRDLHLRQPIYRDTAAYGHFGRDDIDAPWERTDKVVALRADAGMHSEVQGVSGA